MKWLVVLFYSLSLVEGFSSSVGVGSANLSKWKEFCDPELVPLETGGWDAVTKLAEDPKGNLVQLLKESLANDADSTDTRLNDQTDKLETLVSLLFAQGKGYDSKLVNGNWALVLSKNSKKAPKAQKLFGKTEKVSKTFSSFNVRDGEFENTAQVRRNGKLYSRLSFNPVSDGFTKSVDNKIVIRRISCKIDAANFKYKKLPKLPLPFRAKGYLDFVYLDQDMRITRGNRGGLFIHVRPDFLENALLSS